MEETTFAADPMRLMIAAAVGIIVLLVLIIKFKLHPVLSMMISAIIIGAGAGMPLTMISDTVEKGVGKTLQGIALLVGLGSMFGGILEVSGGAQRIAETKINSVLCNSPSVRSCQWLRFCTAVSRICTGGKCTGRKPGNHDHGRNSYSIDLYAGFRYYLGRIYRK